MVESIIVIRTDESLDDRRDDVLEEIYDATEFLGLDGVHATISTRTVDDRWVEGDACRR